MNTARDPSKFVALFVKAYPPTLAKPATETKKSSPKTKMTTQPTLHSAGAELLHLMLAAEAFDDAADLIESGLVVIDDMGPRIEADPYCMGELMRAVELLAPHGELRFRWVFGLSVFAGLYGGIAEDLFNRHRHVHDALDAFASLPDIDAPLEH